ncbi:glycerophosphodiester phosphodiesterase family protein [Arthrobacter sp. H20]|uniref:glycerophosphodiester phosphodiesterase family protein n=1 Tax=Arthrobacter sp. H20 TaxID=1267981 RepID=UPI00047AD4E6|nr:glycerophosphodiester phosphodiesterase family protein [Arthrobacter sp. H20]
MLPYLQNVGPDGQQRPLALSHRGYSADGLENSMAAFEAAVELGYGYLEIDIRSSRDGAVMVFHDALLDRVCDVAGPVAGRTLAELGAVRIRGVEPIPTLEEVLTRWPAIKLNIDIKDDASVEPFARLVERLGAHDRVLVASFSDRRRLQVLKLLSRPVASSAGQLSSALLWLLSPLGQTHRLARILKVDCLQVPVRHAGVSVVTERFVSRCRTAGLPLHVWTVNDAEAMERLLLMGGGVDGLVSDRADRLATVMNARGHWPQAP